MLKKVLVAIVLIIGLINSSFAQEAEKSRTLGLSATIQQGQFGLMLPIWFSKNFVLAPAFQFLYAEKVGMDFSAGLVPRYYFKTEKIAPYLGLIAGVAVNKPAEQIPVFGMPPQDNSARIDFIAGLAFGADYFFDPRFSIGVEAQGNFTKSDNKSSRFGNKGGINFNTATMVTASVYF